MYKFLIRPFLFVLSPEKVHHLVVILLKIAYRIPLFPSILRKFYSLKSVKLQRSVAGIKFPNPVGLAAGFDKNASFYNEFSCFGFGFIEIGSVTPHGQAGNPKPRIFRLKKDKALINRMGFNNEGLEAIKSNLSKKHKVILGGNIGKNTATPNELSVQDYVTCFEGLYNSVDYFVVNVSCPNITNLHKLQDQEWLEKILGAIVNYRKKQAVYKPVFLKISPDLNEKQIDETIYIVEQSGIDGFVISNTTITRTGLKTEDQTVMKIGNGGLSGTPIKDRSTEMIRYVHSKTNGKLPIIGVGGIMSAADALSKLDAGASLLQIYTGFIYEGPGLVKQINKAILRHTSI